MNDRLRMRVWVKEEMDIGVGDGDGMLHVGWLDPQIQWWSLDKYGAIQWGFDDEPLEPLTEHNVIVEQCMGKKDKNGVLVFENDILAGGIDEEKYPRGIMKFGDSFRICWHYDDHNELEYYGWYLEGWCDSWDIWMDGGLQVIGNIHEGETK